MYGAHYWNKINSTAETIFKEYNNITHKLYYMFEITLGVPHIYTIKITSINILGLHKNANLHVDK